MSTKSNINKSKSTENLDTTSNVTSHILNLANELLQICHANLSSTTSLKLNNHHPIIPTKLSSLSQLTSHVYVFIYENICNAELIDKKSPTENFEDEIHNVQAVIDSLSLDVLHEDLSHLTGEAICGAARVMMSMSNNNWDISRSNEDRYR